MPFLSAAINNIRTLPLVYEPESADFSSPDWWDNDRDEIEANLLEYGAILFRNGGINTLDDFERLIATMFGDVIHYKERSTPRTKLTERIYTSTEYPADRQILLHNESSYSTTWPLKICFYCLSQATEQGETPIADVRNIYHRIAPRVRQQFIERGWMLVRNYSRGAGLTWQTAFQTSDREAVEQYCRSSQIEFVWKAPDHLRTTQVRGAVAKHPKTHQNLWFNHLAFWHIASLEPDVREAMLEVFPEEDLPYNTYYGDGATIEPGVIEDILAVYEQEKVTFSWQKNDVLLLDNMLVAHGRNPFKGPRKILVAMAEPCSSRGL
jgi:alpha-ketoglutarate-dependent taurine dioxygenase